MSNFFFGSIWSRLKSRRGDRVLGFDVLKLLGCRLALALVAFSVGTTAVWVLHYRRPANSRAAVMPVPTILGLKPPPPPNLPKVGDVPAPIGRDSKVSLQFITEFEGWLEIDGKLWRTEDGGFTWSELRFPRKDHRYNEYEYALGKFQLLSPRQAWLISDNRLYRTKDGGMSWDEIKQPFPQIFPLDSWPEGLRSVHFSKDGRRGWISGSLFRPSTPSERAEYPDPHTILSEDKTQTLIPGSYYTTDGGESWRFDPVAFNSVFDIDQNRAWAYGWDGLYGFNRGTWKPVTDDQKGEFGNSSVRSLMTFSGPGPVLTTSVFFLDANTGWVTSSTGYVGRTFDGGKNWVDVSWDLGGNGFGINYGGVEIYFLDRDRGWALDGDGKLKGTYNCGVGWKTVDPNLVFRDMSFPDPEHGYVVSAAGLFRVPHEINYY